MSKKREIAVQPLTEQTAEQAAELQKMLAATVDTDVPEGDEVPISFVPQSEVPIPGIDFDPLTGAAQSVAGGSGVNTVTKNLVGGTETTKSNFRAPESILKHYAPDLLAGMEDALKHKEEVKTIDSTYGHGNQEMRMPRAVRDIPNSLHQQVNKHTKRVMTVYAKADKLFDALFGPIAPRVRRLCAQSGFDRKPLLFVGQTLRHQLDIDADHDPSGYIDEQLRSKDDEGNVIPMPFHPELDESPQSIVVRLVNQCLDSITIKHLQRMGRYHEVNILACIRTIMLDICDARRISDPAHDSTTAPLNGQNVGRE